MEATATATITAEQMRVITKFRGLRLCRIGQAGARAAATQRKIDALYAEYRALIDANRHLL